MAENQSTINRHAALRASRVAKGLCFRCGKNPINSRSKWARCDHCAQARRAYRAKRQKDRRERGLCPTCGRVFLRNGTDCGKCGSRLFNSTLGEMASFYPRRFNPDACAICGSPPQSGALALDHCHRRGTMRGLLCKACNFALGCFRDDVEILKSAITYLQTVPKEPLPFER